MNAVAKGIPEMPAGDDTARMISQLSMRRSRAREKARRNIIEALVETVSEQAEQAARVRLQAVGDTRPSGPSAQLARAQARADAYVGILDAILPLVMTDATPEQLYRAVRAVTERIVADYVRVTIR